MQSHCSLFLSLQLKDRYLHDVVEMSTPFSMNSKDKLNSIINLLIDLYTKCVAHGDASTAKRQLRLHQREHIAWERDTVWRQMIGQARRGEGEPGGIQALGGTLLIEEEKGVIDVQTPAGRLKLKIRHLSLLISLVVFVVLLNVRALDAGEEENRCLAILVFATLLWATEAIPLFVTSMLIPLLMVVLRVIRAADGERLGAVEATKYVCC